MATSNSALPLLAWVIRQPFQYLKFGLYSFGEWITEKFRSFLVHVLAAGPLPHHIALIMDGNRRFADRNGIQRITGHIYGYNSLMKTLEICFQLGVKILTVYAFSVDNFKRPPDEVNALLDLLREKLDYLLTEAKIIKNYGVRIQILGDLSLLPPDLQISASRVMNATRLHSKAIFNICLAYDSNLEILHSAHCIHEEALSSVAPFLSSPGADSLDFEGNRETRSVGLIKRKVYSNSMESFPLHQCPFHLDSTTLDPCTNTSSDSLSQNLFQDGCGKQNGVNNTQKNYMCTDASALHPHSHSCSNLNLNSTFESGSDCCLWHVDEMDVEERLYTKGCASVDLLIRTSGETRLSRFLQWQSSNAQLIFCDVLWPEFRFRHIFWCLLQYQTHRMNVSTSSSMANESIS